MRILITGATGFAGGHLVEALLKRGGDELHGLCRRAAWPPEWAHLNGRVALNHADLIMATDLAETLARIKPEWIFHLAGYADNGRSIKEPDEAWAGNLTATKNLYDAVTRWGGKPRILYVSSGLIYGEAKQPINESHLLRPATPYAASKAATDLLSYQQTRHPGLDIIIVRPFNHIGPRQTPVYAIPGWASQLAEIAKGRREPVVRHGDLSSRRDFTDVRDMVQAYILLMENGRKGEAYNAGSGMAVSMDDVLDRLIAISGVGARHEAGPEQSRLVETAATCADSSKLRSETGWTPQISLDQTLTDTLEYWKNV